MPVDTSSALYSSIVYIQFISSMYLSLAALSPFHQPVSLAPFSAGKL